jgi:hypothetical protein
VKYPTKCPHCQKDIPTELIQKWFSSRGGRGKKDYSEEALERRREVMRENRKKRWSK